MSARSRIRRLRDWRARDRALAHLSPTMRWMLGFATPRSPFRPIIHPHMMEVLLRLEAREGRTVDRTRRGWNRFPGYVCQVCARAGHVGPCRRRALEAARRDIENFLQPPKLARVLGEVFLKLAKDLPR